MDKPWRRLFSAAVVASLLVVVTPTDAPAAAPCGWDGPEAVMFRLANQERRERGIERLRCYDNARTWAHGWSRHMADEDLLHHSDLSFPKPRRWSIAGENVGVGGSARSLHEAFMGSAGHRHNILNSTFRFTSIGFIHRDGTAWVTIEFVG